MIDNFLEELWTALSQISLVWDRLTNLVPQAWVWPQSAWPIVSIERFFSYSTEIYQSSSFVKPVCEPGTSLSQVTVPTKRPLISKVVKDYHEGNDMGKMIKLSFVLNRDRISLSLSRIPIEICLFVSFDLYGHICFANECN